MDIGYPLNCGDGFRTSCEYWDMLIKDNSGLYINIHSVIAFKSTEENGKYLIRLYTNNSSLFNLIYDTSIERDSIIEDIIKYLDK